MVTLHWKRFVFVGCKDESGKCHAFGTQIQSKKCVTMECQMRPEGPAFIPTEVGKLKEMKANWK